MKSHIPNSPLQFRGQFLEVWQDKYAAVSELFLQGKCAGTWSNREHGVQAGGSPQDAGFIFTQLEWTFTAASEDDARRAQQLLDSIDD